MIRPRLYKDVEAQAVNVVEVSESEQTREQSTGQHSHSEVESDGQPLPDDPTEVHAHCIGTEE